MKNYLFLIIYVIVIFILLGCRNEVKLANLKDTPKKDTSLITKLEVVKDSIDILIEQRSHIVFNSTIFGGLCFGSNQQKVKRVMKNKTFTKIPIQIGDTIVKQVIVEQFEDEYYNDKLAFLKLYAEEDFLLEELGRLFSQKYGKTKNNQWYFSNCKITIKRENRVFYKFLSGIPYYYDGYYGGGGRKITADDAYLVIEYEDFDLMNLVARQKFLRDSVKKNKEGKEQLRKIEMEKEKAKEAIKNI